MSVDALTALLVAITGVIGAVTVLVKQLQSDRLLKTHVQLHGKDAHPAPDQAAAE